MAFSDRQADYGTALDSLKDSIKRLQRLAGRGEDLDQGTLGDVTRMIIAAYEREVGPLD